MNSGICHVSVVQIRAYKTHKSRRWGLYLSERENTKDVCTESLCRGNYKIPPHGGVWFHFRPKTDWVHKSKSQKTIDIFNYWLWLLAIDSFKINETRHCENVFIMIKFMIKFMIKVMIMIKVKIKVMIMIKGVSGPGTGTPRP